MSRHAESDDTQGLRSTGCASRAGPGAFGLTVLLILLAASWLLSEDSWPCSDSPFGDTTGSKLERCLARAFIIAGASGACVGYLVGLIWERPGPLFWSLAAPWLALFALAGFFLGGFFGVLAFGVLAAAVINLAAEPFGVLARPLLHRLRRPWLGLVLGVVLAAVGLRALVAAPMTFARVTGRGLFPVPGTHYEDLYAVPLLVAGVGTVGVAIWSWLRTIRRPGPPSS